MRLRREELRGDRLDLRRRLRAFESIVGARKSPAVAAKQRASFSGTPSGEDELRAAERRARQGIQRLGGVRSAPQAVEEITPGIYKEDVGIQLARGKKRGMKGPKGAMA